MKKLVSILLICLVLTGCAAKKAEEPPLDLDNVFQIVAGNSMKYTYYLNGEFGDVTLVVKGNILEITTTSEEVRKALAEDLYLYSNGKAEKVNIKDDKVQLPDDETVQLIFNPAELQLFWLNKREDKK